MRVDLQICFVVDIHEPADPGLLKSQIQNIVIDATNKYPTKSVEIAFIGYGGCFCVTNRRRIWNWVEIDKIEYFQKQIDSLEVRYHFTNPCRQVQQGYDLANQLSWCAKRKIIFHLCDGPAFGQEYHTPEVPDSNPYGHAYIVLEEEVEKFARKGVELVILNLNNNCSKMIKVIEQTYNLWKSKSGNGTYVEDLTKEPNRREKVYNQVKKHLLRQFM